MGTVIYQDDRMAAIGINLYFDAGGAAKLLGQASASAADWLARESAAFAATVVRPVWRELRL
ncbi:hypothetical protein ACOJVU_01685 [Mycobacterium sp. THU-M104]|uniref:hypothetical protein n=1 Tax=Mycobacterium sp. THU-M104 TaxID=3410515 RepID=UPI003B9931A5